MANLTPKQEKFVSAYLDCMDAIAASRVSGYAFPETSEKYYVYFLVDPADGRIFYVGKGTKSRIKAHAKAKLNPLTSNGKKHAAIDKVLSAGMSVQEIVFADGMSESSAFTLERHLIQGLREYGLTNISGGVVSSIESSGEKAKMLLSRLKSYEHWVATASVDILNAAIRSHGSTLACYETIKSNFQEIVDYAEASR